MIANDIELYNTIIWRNVLYISGNDICYKYLDVKHYYIFNIPNELVFFIYFQKGLIYVYIIIAINIKLYLI